MLCERCLYVPERDEDPGILGCILHLGDTAGALKKLRDVAAVDAWMRSKGAEASKGAPGYVKKALKSVPVPICAISIVFGSDFNTGRRRKLRFETEFTGRPFDPCAVQLLTGREAVKALAGSAEMFEPDAYGAELSVTDAGLCVFAPVDGDGEEYGWARAVAPMDDIRACMALLKAKAKAEAEEAASCPAAGPGA